eukprot:7352012-Alexandrium_andersonii.AAC.1
MDLAAQTCAAPAATILLPLAHQYELPTCVRHSKPPQQEVIPAYSYPPTRTTADKGPQRNGSERA